MCIASAFRGGISKQDLGKDVHEYVFQPSPVYLYENKRMIRPHK